MGSKTEGTKTRWAEIKGVQRVKEAELRLGYSDGGGRSCGGACGGVVWVTQRGMRTATEIKKVRMWV